MTTTVIDKLKTQNGMQFRKTAEKMTLIKLNQLNCDWLNGSAENKPPFCGELTQPVLRFDCSRLLSLNYPPPSAHYTPK